MYHQKRRPYPLGGMGELRSLITAVEDPLLVSVDFEGTNAIVSGFRKTFNAQAGLSVLDTRTSPSQVSLCISTHHFIVGSETYFKSASEKSLWGTSQRIAKCDMLSGIEACIPKDRNIILIGHGVQAEVIVLEALGFDFGRIHTVFDTYELAKASELGELGLRYLLGNLGFTNSAELFHTASNDAVFTLQTFLLLRLRAVQSSEAATSQFIGLQQVANHGFDVSGHATILPDTTNKWTRATPMLLYGVQVDLITWKDKHRKNVESLAPNMTKRQVQAPPKRFLAKVWTPEI